MIEQQRAQSGACLSGKRDRKTSFVMLRFQKKKLHRSRICELCGFSSRSVSVCQERAHENNLTAERRFWAAFYLFDRELMPTFSFFLRLFTGNVGTVLLPDEVLLETHG